MGKVVLAPYVTLKVRDESTGQLVLLGYYAGAPVPAGADPEDVERLTRKGLIVESGTVAAETLAVPAGTPIPGEPPNVPVTEQPAITVPLAERVRQQEEAAGSKDGRPRQTDPKEAWITYAVALRPEGQSEDDARAEAEGKTKADLVAKYGG
jgi:hypothetical protein